MKNQLSVLALLIVVLLGTCYSAYGGLTEKQVTIIQSQVDITGNVITLTGNKSDWSPQFFSNLTLYVMNSSKSLKLPLHMNGFGPSLSYGNVSGKGARDVLVSAATGGSGGTYNYALGTIKEGKLQQMPIPQSVEITGMFTDGYKAIIRVGDQKAFILDLSSRKDTYDAMGIYRDGKLLKAVKVMIDAYSGMQIVHQDEADVLQGTQRVSGFAHYDGLLDVVSTWRWSGNHWELKKLETKLL